MLRRARLVRIRIYGVIGFFRIRPARGFDGQALIRMRLVGILGYGENRELGDTLEYDSLWSRFSKSAGKSRHPRKRER